MLESNYELIQTTTLTRYNDKTNSIIKMEPLFEEYYESDNKEISFNLSFYTFLEFRKNNSNVALAVVINDLKVNAFDALKAENNRPIIDAKIHFNEPLIYEGNSYDFSEETFLNVFDSSHTILLFNYDFLVGSNGPLNIKKIELSYRTTLNINKSLLTLSNSDLEDISYDGFFNNTYNRNINNVTYESANTFEDFTVEELQNNDSFYFNSELTKILKKFNSIYFYSLGIEFLIILPLTYFLFIHKDFKNYLLNKKYKRKEEN